MTTTPGVNHHAVAEHTIAMLMAVARGFPDLDRCVRDNRWNRVARPRVMGRTLGIVGLGRIGRAVAWRPLAFGASCALRRDPQLKSATPTGGEARTAQGGNTGLVNLSR